MSAGGVAMEELPESNCPPGAESPPRFPAGTIFDKYRLVRRLGLGGMAEVYLAEHLLLNRRCALKILFEKPDPGWQKRFLREARCICDLSHPNIVKIHDAGCDPATGRLFIAMEFVDGTPLSELSGISEAELLAVATDMAHALAALEAAHIVHRDIKPANILRSAGGGYKLMDLGIAKTAPGGMEEHYTLTLERAVFGTPAYASPEQCRDAHSADTRSDIYSLGASLYHLASGRPPYRGPTPVETILRVLQSPLEPLGKLRPDLSAPLCELIHAMLRKSPAQRPQNAGELLRLIDGVRGGERRGGRRSSGGLLCMAAVGLAALLLGAGAFALRGNPTGKAAASPPAAVPKPRSVSAPELPEPVVQEFARFGVAAVVDRYGDDASGGRKLSAADLAADARRVLDEFNRLGGRAIRISGVRRVVFRGVGVRAGRSRRDTLVFSHRTVRNVRRELMHRYDPFVNSYRYWSSLNSPGFDYLGNLRRGVMKGATNREILRGFSVALHFARDFAAAEGQQSPREDFATIAELTSPAAVDKWRERAADNPAFKRKWYTAIAVCAEHSGYDPWRKFYRFTPEELAEIRAHAVDPARHSGFGIAYSGDLVRRGEQWRTAMVLTGLDRRLLSASGIRRIEFPAGQVKPELKDGVLALADADAHGLVMSVFAAVCRRDQRRLRECGIRRSPERAAHLFHLCFFNVPATARRMAETPEFYREVEQLRRFTAPWLPEEFWSDLFEHSDGLIADREFEREFASLGIVLDAPLPASVGGRRCKFDEVRNGSRAFKAVCSFLTPEFIRATGIRKVAFARELTKDDVRISGGCVEGDTLCLDPDNAYLVRQVLFELFLNFDRRRPASAEWHALNPSGFCYGDREPADAFVSRQAMIDESSDRADTFALLLLNPWYVAGRAKNSPAVRGKVEFVRKLRLWNARGRRIVGMYDEFRR